MILNGARLLSVHLARNMNLHQAFYIGTVLAVIILFYLSRLTRVPEASWQMQHPISDVDLEPAKPEFKAGTAKPPGEPYTQTMVMAKLQGEDISWLYNRYPDANTTIYIVDDEPDKLKIPKNKGREAMVYLTYMIDHYDSLPDISLFFHPHQFAWHNSDLHGQNILTMLEMLNPAHIARVGYMPLRCQHDPGCPHWLHLDLSEDQLNTSLRLEEKYFTSEVWLQLHPGVPLPETISEPCCSQFALSRDRIRSQPVSEYIRYRNWLLNTTLDDEISGRWMEYSWQYLFTGQAKFCPSQNICFCDGYGICFGGDAEVQNYLDKMKEMQDMRNEADRLKGQGERPDEVIRLRAEANVIGSWMNTARDQAIERGKCPRNRAIDCGRPWQQGDGF